MRRSWWTPGNALFVIGALHQTVGLAGGAGAIAMPGGDGRNLFAELVRAGVVGAVEPDPQRQLLFWFLAFGALLLVFGRALHRWEAGGGPLPAAVGWQLVVFALVGGLLIPVSGFWLVLVPGLWVLRRARRADAASAGDREAPAAAR